MHTGWKKTGGQWPAVFYGRTLSTSERDACRAGRACPDSSVWRAEQCQLRKDLADLGNLRFQVSLGMPWFCDLSQHLSLLNLFLRLLSSQNLP